MCRPGDKEKEKGDRYVHALVRSITVAWPPGSISFCALSPYNYPADRPSVLTPQRERRVIEQVGQSKEGRILQYVGPLPSPTPHTPCLIVIYMEAPPPPLWLNCNLVLIFFFRCELYFNFGPSQCPNTHLTKTYACEVN